MHAAQPPIHRGFGNSLAMLSGAADHFTNERMGAVDLWLGDARLATQRHLQPLLVPAHAIAGIGRTRRPPTTAGLYMPRDVHGPTGAAAVLHGYNSSI